MFAIQVRGSAGQGATTDRDPRIMRAAREFESELLGSLFSSLEKSFTSLDGDDQGTVLNVGSEVYQAMGMRALAAKLAASGGLGIAQMISRELASKQPANLSGATAK
jgi:Rod binding domain-containing protein